MTDNQDIAWDSQTQVAPAQLGPKLIACSACAKAKAKCDRKVPSCTRCISKNLACEVRATRRTDRPTAYLKRRRTDENVIGNADFSAPAYQEHTFTTNVAPIYTGDIATALPIDTYLPLHNVTTMTHEWPKQPFSVDHMLDSNFWNPSMATSIPNSGLNFDSVPMLPQEISVYDAQPSQAPNPGPSARVSSMESDSSMSENPANRETDSSCPSISPAHNTPSLVYAGSGTGNDDNNEAVEDWPMFKCIPASYVAINPELGRVYLEGLLHVAKGSNGSSGRISSSNSVVGSFGRNRAALFDSYTRDKLMGLTQCFLVKGWETHSKGGSRMSNTVTLPALADLHAYFQSFVCHYEPFYAIFPLPEYNVTQLIDDREESISCLMLLLMIGQGALTAHPTPRAQLLSLGITEACRIGILDLLEKNVSMSIQPDMLRCILVYINLASWCGTRWHMDVALSQHAMYLSMLKHSGILNQQELDLPSVNGRLDVDIAWRTWKEHESKKRLAYAWVIVDQELSLFQDIPPKLGLADIKTEFPDAGTLWETKDAEEWLHAVMCGYNDKSQKQIDSSLPALFRRFMDDGASMEVPKRGLSPLQLRALLHPLQRLICHVHECLSCFSSGGNNRQAHRLIGQLEEAQATLQQWYRLSSRAPQKPSHFCSATFANLITYHLISLNTVTCFPEMEALARGEVMEEDFKSRFWATAKLIVEAKQIYVHCGQIMNLVRMIPDRHRPPWWAAAIYRVAIIMWATSVANESSSSRTRTADATLQFPIDGVMPEHSSVTRYLRFNEGVPVLAHAQEEDGTITPVNVLSYCVDMLREADCLTPLVKGIVARLEKVLERMA